MKIRPLSKTEIYEEIAKSTSFPKKDVRIILENLSKLAQKELEETGEFKFLDLGKFVKINRPARKMISPLTKSEVMVPAKQSIKFRVSKTLKNL